MNYFQKLILLLISTEQRIKHKGALYMPKTDRELKVYSNINDVDVSKIPQSVMNDIAKIIYSAMCRNEAEKQEDVENN